MNHESLIRSNRRPRSRRYYGYYKCQTLSAMDVLAPTPMKNAVKCDTSCELQNQWVIKTLNASCTSLYREVCLLECLFIPTIPHSLKQGEVLNAAHRFLRKARADEKTNLITDPIQCNAGRTRDDIITRLKGNTSKLCSSISYSQLGPPISQEYPLNLSI